MQTVGQLLKKTREEKLMTLGEVEKRTKIRMKYLIALEADDYRVLPSAIVAKGFIKNYGGLLDLPVATLLALFRRDFLETESGQVVPRGMVKPLDRAPTFGWTPTRTVVLAISVAGLLLSGYFVRQLVILGSSPSLVVDAPKENELLSEHLVRVAGRTDPDVAVTANQQLASVNSDGQFQTAIELPSGRNTISVVALNKSKKETKVARVVDVK